VLQLLRLGLRFPAVLLPASATMPAQLHSQKAAPSLLPE
jgi:hypothetical protein